MKGQTILHYLSQAKIDDDNHEENTEYEPADASLNPSIQQFSRKKRRM